MIDCTKQYTIKVTEGNAFGLLLTLKTRTFVSSQPVDADIDASELQDIVVKLNNQVFTDHTEDENGVLLAIPADLARGTYNVELTATYNGIEIRAAYFECFTIMPWSYQSDAQNYIPGSPIVAEAAYIVSDIISDEELERLKEEYRQKIADAEEAEQEAEEAKQEYIEKAEQLDDVASETNATANKTAVLAAIEAAKAALQGGDTTATLSALKTAIDNIDIDATTIAKQGTNASATLTATQAAVVDGNDTAISAIKEVRSEVGTSSDTASETGTTLFAVLKWVKDKVKSIFQLIGSPASGQPSTLFAAIAAGGGGGGEVITYPTVQMTATTASVDANKVYIWGEVASLDITLNAGEAGVANVYFLEFYSGTTHTTLTLPASVTDIRGNIKTNSIVNVAILNGVAYIA